METAVLLTLEEVKLIREMWNMGRCSYVIRDFGYGDPFFERVRQHADNIEHKLNNAEKVLSTNAPEPKPGNLYLYYENTPPGETQVF